jgi:LmbE family N-acetylglucosaminyl deacetylase
MMPSSLAEWELVATRFGGARLPVVADVMREWRRRGGDDAPPAAPSSVSGGARLLAISPHPDDAAFSVGGLLDLTCGAWERHVGTLVGVSEYELRPAPAGADPVEVSARRREEDRRFAAVAGVALHAGTVLDAPLRNPGLSPFRAPLDAHVAEFAAVIDRWVREIQPTLLLAPLGIGGHADHRAARLATCGAAREHRIDLLLYEDVPYAAEPNDGGESPSALTEGWTRRLLPIGPALARKAACLAVYASQLDLAPVQRVVCGHAWDGSGCFERLWVAADRPLSAETETALGLVAEACA